MNDLLSLIGFTLCLFFIIAIPVAIFHDSGAYASAVNARAAIQMQRQIELTERARIRSESFQSFLELSSIVVVSVLVIGGLGVGTFRFLNKQADRNYERDMQFLAMVKNQNLLPISPRPPDTNYHVTNNYFNINPTPVDPEIFKKLLDSKKFEINKTEEGYFRVVNPATQEVKLLNVKL